MLTYEIPQTKIVNFNHTQIEFCFPKKEKCFSKPSGLLVECGEGWNCLDRTCDTDKDYSNCVPEDGLIYLPIRFYDFISQDRTNPSTSFSDLIRVSICSNLTDGFVEIDPTTISSAMNNCFSGKYNYQLICLDFAKILALGHKCFHLKFEADNGQCCDSQSFNILTKDECSTKGNRLVSLESKGGGEDCDNNFYGDPVSCFGDNITYRNIIYVKAECKLFGGAIESEFQGIKKVSSTVKKRARVIFTELVPPYLTDFLICAILSGETIFKNGEEWSMESIELTPRESSNMSLPTIEFYRECNRLYSCV